MKSNYSFELIESENSVVITASQRLSRHIREEFNRSQFLQGKKVWSSLDVMPWNAWTSVLWSWLNEQWPQQQASLPYVLKDQQSLFLWQDIVEQSNWNDYLLQIPATAKKAWQAWQQYQEWQLKISESAAWDKDLRAFKDWSHSFAQQLEHNHWLDSSSSLNWLIEHFSVIKGLLPKHIYLAGFEQITPQQQQLFDLFAKNSTVQWLTRQKKASQPQVINFNNRREEFRFVIQQAKKALQTNFKQNPNYKFAIVVPELEQYKPLLERLLWQELTPSFVDDKTNEAIYDFSLGEPLSSQPVVITALNILKLLKGSVELSEVRQVLLSPYWGDTKESVTARAEIDLKFRSQHKQRLKLDDLIYWDSDGQLTELLGSLAELKKELADKRTLIEWMALLPKMLERASWPGYRVLSSREYQIHQTLLDSFNSLRDYQLVANKTIGFSQLLELIFRIVSEKQFHQEQPKAPIQVMGLLETLGLEFDQVWLTGATYQVLPTKPSPNPFIDKLLLKKHEMPGSSSQRELDYANQLLASLCLSSEQVSISYSLFEGDSELLPSPLLSRYQHQSIASDPLMTPIPLRSARTDEQLEFYEDEFGVALEQREIKGGTGFFKDQINCPFKAYLSYRLDVKAFDEVEQGLNAMERGQIVHKALEFFWRQQDSSEILKGKNDEDLSRLIEPSLTQALEEFKPHFYYLQIDDFFINEKSRLLQQLTKSLVIDAKRLPFTPLHHEQRQTIEVAELIFNLQVDRIDQVDDGLLIIDYKTGSPTRQALLTEPPEEPQLALYAINQKQDTIAGVSFFNINAKEVRYQGLADTIENLALNKRSAIKTPVSDLITNWQLQLKAVGEEIKQGKAIVNPRSCDYCDFSAVCRINQRQKELVSDTSAEEVYHD
ncbi:MAG: PD-(D/E)XK nuclease family protein [Kangiellaceae bacterium]|nr:PD-(D/E)XK nuclease family protein [Kangiellaceae bacterium]